MPAILGLISASFDGHRLLATLCGKYSISRVCGGEGHKKSIRSFMLMSSKLLRGKYIRRHVKPVSVASCLSTSVAHTHAGTRTVIILLHNKIGRGT